MGVTQFPNGVSSFGVPLVGSGVTIPASTGTYFFVDSVTGSNSNSGLDKAHPLATITYATSLCTASKGDVVICMPGHSETVTAAITLSKAGVYYIGLGWGRLKPTIIGNFAGDPVDITAANVTFDNFHFAAPVTDAQTSDINVSGSGVTIRNITAIGSTSGSVNVVDMITLASGANDCLIENVQFWNTTTAVNSFLSIEAAIARLTVKNFVAFGDCVTAGIIDGATATQLYFENIRVGTVGTTIAAAILDSNPTGLISNAYFAGTSTTLANNAALGTGVRLFDVRVLEETDGSKQGVQIPAVDVD